MEGNKNNPKDNNKQIGEMKGLLNTQPRQGSVPLYTDRLRSESHKHVRGSSAFSFLPPLFLFIVFKTKMERK